MKMTKKLFVVAIATAAFALTSCGMGAGSTEGRNSGTKKNLTISKHNTGNGPLYKREWKQLGTKETVKTLETLISIDVTAVDGIASTDDKETWVEGDSKTTPKFTHAVVGLIFDLHETKLEDGTKVNDFVLIGYRPAVNVASGDTAKPGFYVERYTNVPKSAFEAATNYSSFSDDPNAGINVEYLASKTGKTTSATVYYIDVPESTVEKTTGRLGKDDDGKGASDKDVSLQKFPIVITQDVPGTYVIKAFGEEFEYKPADESEAHPDWYTKDNKLTKNVNEGGYRLGGAGYYVNVPVGTDVNANFNSKVDADGDGKNITDGLEEEVDE